MIGVPPSRSSLGYFVFFLQFVHDLYLYLLNFATLCTLVFFCNDMLIPTGFLNQSYFTSLRTCFFIMYIHWFWKFDMMCGLACVSCWQGINIDAIYSCHFMIPVCLSSWIDDVIVVTIEPELNSSFCTPSCLALNLFACVCVIVWCKHVPYLIWMMIVCLMWTWLRWK